MCWGQALQAGVYHAISTAHYCTKLLKLYCKYTPAYKPLSLYANHTQLSFDMKHNYIGWRLYKGIITLEKNQVRIIQFPSLAAGYTQDSVNQVSHIT